MKLLDPENNRPEGTAREFVVRNWEPAGGTGEGLVWESLSGDGSDRRFARVRAGDRTAVLVYGPDPAENRSYEMIGRHIWRAGKFGPEFLAADQALGLFLVEDLGSVSLQDYSAGTDEVFTLAIYGQVVGLLARFHERGLTDFDPAWCHQTPRYDRNLILKRETGYFLSAFVEGWLGRRDWPASLPAEFEALAAAALEGAETVLMHRDFQSRNVMIKQGRPRFIDFQGARPGPPGYDLASLLYDPYTPLSAGLEERIFNLYVRKRYAYGGFDEKSFRAGYPYLAACRLLQALGAYGFLSRNKGKTSFEAFIPDALRSLERLIATPAFDFMPGLRELVAGLGVENGGGQ
ncbi:MAG: phosphotransferase [Thermodesulfobacteriota bacterium]